MVRGYGPNGYLPPAPVICATRYHSATSVSAGGPPCYCNMSSVGTCGCGHGFCGDHHWTRDGVRLCNACAYDRDEAVKEQYRARVQKVIAMLGTPQAPPMTSVIHYGEPFRKPRDRPPLGSPCPVGHRGCVASERDRQSYQVGYTLRGYQVASRMAHNDSDYNPYHYTVKLLLLADGTFWPAANSGWVALPLRKWSDPRMRNGAVELSEVEQKVFELFQV